MCTYVLSSQVRLNIGRIIDRINPVNNFLLTGTVPVNNFLLTGTVLVNNFLLTGTVPVNNSLLTGTLSNVHRCWLAMPLGAGFLRWVLGGNFLIL